MPRERYDPRFAREDDDRDEDDLGYDDEAVVDSEAEDEDGEGPPGTALAIAAARRVLLFWFAIKDGNRKEAEQQFKQYEQYRDAFVEAGGPEAAEALGAHHGEEA